MAALLYYLWIIAPGLVECLLIIESGMELGCMVELQLSLEEERHHVHLQRKEGNRVSNPQLSVKPWWMDKIVVAFIFYFDRD